MGFLKNGVAQQEANNGEAHSTPPSLLHTQGIGACAATTHTHYQASKGLFSAQRHIFASKAKDPVYGFNPNQ